MGDVSKIEWADSTFNPWIGCTKVSPACDHCYAEAMMDTRMGRVKWGTGNPRSRTSEANWRKPVRWNAKAESFWECGECGWRGEKELDWFDCPACEAELGLLPARRRVFCASLADVFDNEVDPQWRADLFCLIRATPNLDWLVLTKRIGNVNAMVDQALDDGHLKTSREPLWPWPNVWLGATICNQQEADRDIPKLLATPAAVRFLSVEPMLGHVDLKLMARAYGFPKHITHDGRAVGMPQGIHWVICGGESGPNARPMHPDWARSLRDQCAAAGVPFLFKQWGEWAPYGAFGPPGRIRDRLRVRDELVYLVGKRLAGRTLDGRTHDGFPS